MRALLFLHAIHRYHLPTREGVRPRAPIPADAHAALLERRFEPALARLLEVWRADGPSHAIGSALAEGYRALAFATLAEQVRASVRGVPENAWMFALDDPGAHPRRVHAALLGGALLHETTPVRMDLSHSAWSDIFFLAMDRPEWARVLNASVDLAVHGRDPAPRPPIEVSLRVVDEPGLHLESLDLGAATRLREVADVFDFARDHLGLLRAGVIAGGLVPPGLEGVDAPLAPLLERLLGGSRGLRLVTHVRGIPKGSRLAVSTNLLAAIIAVVMRATGQTRALTGPLTEDERRLVAARAILGEWLGGSGGGWQDSGGLWPGLKLIEGARAQPGDPEYGVSRGRLLPRHTPIEGADALTALRRSLVLVHGGMAQDVGPVLEMVTEKYLLRSAEALAGRRTALALFDEILSAVRRGDVRAIGAATHRNFLGPIRAIIPAAHNAYTEAVIEALERRFGAAFWGFWMLGGMSGGGMGLLFDPEARARAVDEVGPLMLEAKRRFEPALPFAMDPVVYDFAIDEVGTTAALAAGDDDATAAAPAQPASTVPVRDDAALQRLLDRHGFDAALHERLRDDLRTGRLGLARNRLPATTRVEDARADDVLDAATEIDAATRARGEAALGEGRVAIVTLAGGSGSRWTQGAGVVKALHPFWHRDGAFRTFLDVHIAKARLASRHAARPVPHVVTTSYLTHAPTEAALARLGADRPITSPGSFVGLRLVPTERDLRFAWHETPRQRLDEQAHKVQASLEQALIDWARAAGEASDYRDNLPLQCLHPIGHWYEVPAMLLNGTLARLLDERPELTTLMLHNVDTLGADVDAGLLGLHLRTGAALTFEVVPRRHEDRGGGLARVDGRLRLVESLALPRDDDELALTLYNSMTTWIDIDAWLAGFGLAREDLGDGARVAAAVRATSDRLPTYVTLKDVKRRWGHGHEDVFPVAQFERLWSDVTTLPEFPCAYAIVTRTRGQQLKEPAQLDGWLRDGSADAIAALCGWA